MTIKQSFFYVKGNSHFTMAPYFLPDFNKNTGSIFACQEDRVILSIKNIVTERSFYNSPLKALSRIEGSKASIFCERITSCFKEARMF